MNLFENILPPGDLMGEIGVIIHNHIAADAGYSGVENAEVDSAAYSIAAFPDQSREDILKTIKGIETYDPWEGLEIATINNIVNDICEKLGVE